MKNITRHDFNISKADRNKMNSHRSFVLWFTGLSGSGKSTLANLVEKELFNQGIRTFSLDGDNIRSGLNQDLQFSPKEREENLRRVAEISKLFIDAGIVIVASFISPLQKDREHVKDIIGDKDFIEVFVNTSLEECERRDVKGLYCKARKGEIKNFTGIDAPYEVPEDPDFEVKTEEENLEKAVKRIVAQLQEKLNITL